MICWIPQAQYDKNISAFDPGPVNCRSGNKAAVSITLCTKAPGIAKDIGNASVSTVMFSFRTAALWYWPDSLSGDVKGHWAESSITSLAGRYDLEDVFPGIQTSFMPNNKATAREIMLLYEKIIGKSAENTGLDPKNKLLRLGLDDVLSQNALARNADRQQTAAVLCRLFSVKKGVDAASLRPAGRTFISDESSIRDDYYNSVIS